MELEFLICQYLDGSLQGEAREDLETRLAMDANARALLDAQRQIDQLFAGQGLGRTALASTLDREIDWDQFASRIAVAVATAPVDPVEIASDPVSEEVAPARSRMRLPRKLTLPAFSFRGLPYRAIGTLAIAASLLLAVGTVARFYFTRNHQTSVVAQPQSVAIVLQVSGPQVESTPGDGVSEVSIGPAKSLSSNSMAIDESDDLVSRPSRVVIASGINPDQDRSGLPY